MKIAGDGDVINVSLVTVYVAHVKQQERDRFHLVVNVELIQTVLMECAKVSVKKAKTSDFFLKCWAWL